MTRPEDPGDDWGFPAVDPADPADSAGPASTRLPEPEAEAATPEQFDTGSDAWWRAQAQAQRAAAATDPVVPPAVPAPTEPAAPPELVEASVLNAPNPLDDDWVPPDLPELRPPAPEAEPPRVTYARPPGAADPDPVDEPDTDHHGIPAVEDPIWTGPSYDDVPRERSVPEPGRVSVLRAVAGAGIAVAGVVLAICALLLFGDDEPKGTPTVASPPTASVAPTTVPSTEPTTAPTEQPSPTTAPSASPAVVTAPVVPVSVLNNSKVKNLAKRAADRFEAGGWPVGTTGNYSGGTIATTTVYYAEGQRASAERFAAQFGIPRVAPRFAGLPTQGMTVVVTRDYRA